MAPANGTVQFTIDARASLFTVQAFASGIVSVVAHSPKFAMRDVAGEIKMDLNRIENSSVRFVIKVASLEIMDEVTSADRREIERVMFGEVLESSVYPLAEFRGSRVSGAKTGDNLARVTIASVAGRALKLKDELEFGFFVIARRKS